MVHCFKCETEDGKIIKHHIKYEPEVIVDCCWSCHQTIHNRVKREQICHIPHKELIRISCRSSSQRYKQASQQIYFQETLSPGIRIREMLLFNFKLGTVVWSAGFEATNNRKLIELPEGLVDIPDELITKIGMLGLDAQTFIKEALEEKLQRLGEEE